MKKLLMGVLAILAMASLVACGNKNVEPTSSPNPSQNQVEVVPSNSVEPVVENVSNEEMYANVISSYQTAMAEYDLENIPEDEEFMNQYPFVSGTLLTHVLRYSGDGVKMTYSFYDINHDGVDELLMGANGSIGAIYAYDKTSKNPVKIYFQSTMERGNLDIYDNGVILSEGAGGAALHYYEFGRIAENTATYELIESIEEEYVDASTTPVYRDSTSRETLAYTSLDEIMNKYVSGAAKIQSNSVEL